MKFELAATGICPGCFSARPLKPRYQLPEFGVYRCAACELVFIDPSLTARQQVELYQDSGSLSEINPALEHYYEYDVLKKGCRTRRDFEKALQVAKEHTVGRELCEIGCGTGAFLVLAQSAGWSPTGIDSSRQNIAALQARGINGLCADFFGLQPEARFDCVVLWDVLEHPQKPKELLRVSLAWLKPGGILLIASPCYPNLLAWIAGLVYDLTGGAVAGPLEKMYALEHTSYFSPKTMARLLASEKIKICQLWKTETDLNRYAFKAATLFFLHMSFWAARILGLQNRLILIGKRDV